MEGLKPTLAGVMISIGCILYTSVDNSIIGSVLFSTGLIAIIVLNLDLYTGKIGYANNKDDYIECFQILLYNIFGSLTTCIVLTASIDLKKN